MRLLYDLSKLPMLAFRYCNYLKITGIALLTFCLWAPSYAQQYLDEQCWLATASQDNVEENLKIGYRAMFFHESAPSDHDLAAIKEFLMAETDPLILVFDQIKPKLLSELNQFIYAGSVDDHVFGPKLSTVNKLYIFSYDGNFLNASNYFKEAPGKHSLPANNLTIFNDNNNLSLEELKEQLKRLHHESGYLPNIFISDRHEIAKPIIDSINYEVYYNAIVLEDGVKLGKVSWDTTALISNGKIHTQLTRVGPYKRGYMFSPDVINFNANNSSSIKIFRAHKRRLNDDLTLQLSFDNNLINEINPSWAYRYANIEFIKDNERSWVGEFSGREKYIDFGNILGNIKSEITISVWIKPYELTNNRSIVGVGESFSAKIFNGNLVFTTPDIRDHINKSNTIPKDKWSFVSFVYDSDRYVHFYVNGQLINSLPASTITSTSQSLIIGTNLWDEFFIGKMDDLKIWKRALSDGEIRQVYDQGINPGEKSISNYWIIITVISTIIILGIIWKFGVQLKPISNSLKRIPQLKTSGCSTYNLRLFDGFQLNSRSGVSLTNQLSPQRKELFLLTLFHTIRNGGITTKQMANILWVDYSAESAKNNRSTQMVRLREILVMDTGISLNYLDKLWQIQFEPSASCDLEFYQAFKNQLSNDVLTESQLTTLLEIMGNGVLLPKLEYEWLDKFKGEITNEILEMITPCYQSDECLNNKKLMVSLTDTITRIDPLNEQALHYQLNLFLKEGKHSLARHTFESYQKAYFNFYNESFSKNFTDYIAEV